VVTERQASYWPDIAAEIDSEEEIIADKYGVSLDVARQIIEERDTLARQLQAEILANVIGLILRGRNIQVMVHSLAIAFGLDELNGAHSQAEIARQLGVTRALVSHYVLGWRDVLSGGVAAFDCTKFRKKNSTRATYAAKAANPVIQAKRNRHEHNNRPDHVRA
jgi:hypothetical protein